MFFCSFFLESFDDEKDERNKNDTKCQWQEPNPKSIRFPFCGLYSLKNYEGKDKNQSKFEISD
jgi:hypothetical protein